MNTTSHLSLVRALIGLASIVALSLFNGCASYHLGSASEIPFKSIYIKPATNHSFAPQAQPIVSAQIREAFIRDARVKLVTSEEAADAVLFVDLAEYERNAGTRSSQDTAVANDFNIRLTANISLFNQAQGDYLFKERSIQADTQAYTGNPYSGEIISYQQSERQAMTQLAREIARKITDEVLSPW
jgi:outer membrane lipopolysaccharide assembly protein LptE/RlpB